MYEDLLCPMNFGECNECTQFDPSDATCSYSDNEFD